MSNVVTKMDNINNPFTLVIFGATGDLYQNKLALALFNLFSSGALPAEFSIIGFARRSLTDLDFHSLTEDAILKINSKASKTNLKNFLKHVKYIRGDLENIESFKNLGRQLALDDEQNEVCTNKLFYLAVQPSLYAQIFKNISGAGLTVPCASGLEEKNKAWTRVLVEKPFGTDIKEAKRLEVMLEELFNESQIFRIDHYLAYLSKGVVERILDFRFGGEETESRFNNKNLESVRIIFHEKDLVGKRGAFYDSLGAFLDVGQSHMLQMLALVAMDNPKLYKSNGGIHKARQMVLEKVKLSEKDPIVRGQYEGYLKEAGVKPESETETFFQLTLLVDNKKWKGIPFILEFGKALNESQVLIEVCFHDSKTCLNFPVSNEDTLRDAYEKVFYDCILGDHTIFVSAGEVMEEWAIATLIQNKWQSVPLIRYSKGSKAEDISAKGGSALG